MYHYLFESKGRPNRRLSLPNGSTGVRGLAMSPDGRFAVVTHLIASSNRAATEGRFGWLNANINLDDASARSIRLAPEKPMTQERQGELYFNDARLYRQGWQGCASCHPDGRGDGLNWDLVNDGIGNPKNTKSMLWAHCTPPMSPRELSPTQKVRASLGKTTVPGEVGGTP